MKSAKRLFIEKYTSGSKHYDWKEKELLEAIEKDKAAEEYAKAHIGIEEDNSEQPDKEPMGWDNITPDEVMCILFEGVQGDCYSWKDCVEAMELYKFYNFPPITNKRINV